MMLDELDRILGSEESLEPSSGLAATAMDAIRKEAAAPEPVPFPWRRVVPGLAISLALLAAGIIILAVKGTPESPFTNSFDLQGFLQSPLGVSTTWAAGSLLATYLLTHLSFRLIIRRI
jgi:hypothetical protein